MRLQVRSDLHKALSRPLWAGFLFARVFILPDAKNAVAGRCGAVRGIVGTVVDSVAARGRARRKRGAGKSPEGVGGRRGKTLCGVLCDISASVYKGFDRIATGSVIRLSKCLQHKRLFMLPAFALVRRCLALPGTSREVAER